MGRNGESGEGFEEVGPCGENGEARDGGEVTEKALSLFRGFSGASPGRLQEIEQRVPGESEQVERGERHGQKILAVAEVVLEFVAVVLEYVEAFVLDLPPRATAGDDVGDI